MCSWGSLIPEFRARADGTGNQQEAHKRWRGLPRCRAPIERDASRRASGCEDQQMRGYRPDQKVTCVVCRLVYSSSKDLYGRSIKKELFGDATPPCTTTPLFRAVIHPSFLSATNIVGVLPEYSLER